MDSHRFLITACACGSVMIQSGTMQLRVSADEARNLGLALMKAAVAAEKPAERSPPPNLRLVPNT